LGQIEVFELLKRERQTGSEKFYSVSEVEKLMKQNGYTNGCIKTVRSSLLLLYEFEYLDSVTSGKWSDWKRSFRVKDKYLEEKKHG
jgi:hypothetical protein